MIATTIISSISVKPRLCLVRCMCAFPLFMVGEEAGFVPEAYVCGQSRLALVLQKMRRLGSVIQITIYLRRGAPKSKELPFSAASRLLRGTRLPGLHELIECSTLLNLVSRG